MDLFILYYRVRNKISVKMFFYSKFYFNIKNRIELKIILEHSVQTNIEKGQECSLYEKDDG